ncbi:MAG: SUMF1/EgtB/PvdO family nonheme iron enzyme [Acidobacteriota bacterium]
MAERYTQVPRSTLWLLPEGDLTIGDGAGAADPPFEAETRPIYIGKSVVSNVQYEAFDPGHARSELSPGDDHPATMVSFRDAVAYCEWYSQLSKKSFRLPTEIEWEHACRAETTTRFPFGDDPDGHERQVWAAENSDGTAHPIESLKANPFGLHDLLGNVFEWTSSLFRPYPVTDEEGDRDDLGLVGPRAVRGGSFRTSIDELGSSRRWREEEDVRRDDVGFRIVRYL